jgi:hypothetical protein
MAHFGSFRNQYRNSVSDAIDAAAPSAGQHFIAEIQVSVAGRAGQAAQRRSVELGSAGGWHRTS